jgi:hypothetical protein
MSGFTEEIRRFLASQGIDESEVLDASRMSSRRYKGAMEREDKLFAMVSNPCYQGHYLKNRSGHCIQCDTARIAFIKRHYKDAYVYIVGSRSERVLKIGYSDTPWDRGPHLNHLGYGGISDWKVLYYARFPDAGKVEFNVHNALAAFASPRKYFREGVETDCREIFACAYITVRNALGSASPTVGADEWEYHLASRLYGFVGYLLRE